MTTDLTDLVCGAGIWSTDEGALLVVLGVLWIDQVRRTSILEYPFWI